MNQIKQIYGKIKQYVKKQPVLSIIQLSISIYFVRQIIKNRLLNVKLSYFLQALKQNLISEIIICGSYLKFRAKDSTTWYQTNSELLTKERLYKLVSDKDNITFSCEPSAVQSNQNTDLQQIQLLFGVTGLIMAYKLYSQNSYQAKNSKDLLKEKLRFKDIAGLDEAKNKLNEIINFLKSPEKYQKVGARLRKGVLLYGPPGTGKTMLAKATAGESHSSFLYTTASEFVEMYVGVGAKRIRELFNTARKQSPCIIFIDEIDGMGQKRSKGTENNSDSERATTLNQLLTEMDGFSESSNIVVIAATNREQLLDNALVRSGRFDTKIKINLPDLNDRFGVLKIHTQKKQHQIKEETLQEIAKNTIGYSGADLESIVNESAYICINNDKQIISDEDIMQAFQKFNKEQFAFKQNSQNQQSQQLLSQLQKQFLQQSQGNNNNNQQNV